jgi:hypothetical protein
LATVSELTVAAQQIKLSIGVATILVEGDVNVGCCAYHCGQ